MTGEQPPADGEWMSADERDTFRLATLIAQSLSGGTITGTTGIPGEVIFTARLIKGQGWTQPHPNCRCTRTDQ
jgi:hypothetical protein